MSITTAILDNATLGYVGVETHDDDGSIINRRVLHPGVFVDGLWQDTDITGEEDAVRAVCIAAWTPDVIAALQAAYPWVAPLAAAPDPMSAAKDDITSLADKGDFKAAITKLLDLI